MLKILDFPHFSDKSFAAKAIKIAKELLSRNESPFRKNGNKLPRFSSLDMDHEHMKNKHLTLRNKLKIVKESIIEKLHVDKICRDHAISKSTFYRLLKTYHDQGLKEGIQEHLKGEAELPKRWIIEVTSQLVEKRQPF